MSGLISKETIDLDKIDSESLRNVLKRRNFLVFRNLKQAFIEIDEYEMVQYLESMEYRVLGKDESDFDSDEMDEALARYRRGDIAEAIIWLERALPDGFSGLSDRVRAS